MNFTQKNSYSYQDLLKCAEGALFGPGNAQLPMPPMLMFDRIVNITADGGEYGHGQIEAEMDVRPDLWFFDCHFKSDPVMPGCLGLDALWQLVGFYLGWSDAPGKGRALGVGEVKFTGTVLPKARLITYLIDIKRVVRRKVALAFADGTMKVDGEPVYKAKGLRVGVFEDPSEM